MRRWLVVFLAAAAALLSFDALRAHALESGVIPDHAVLPREWLASLWALVIDAAAAAGILGVRTDRRDPRAWLMLVLAFTASVGFQVWTPPTELARAVPPVVLALAIVVLELPRRSVELAGTAVVPGFPSPGAVPAAAVGERAPDPVRAVPVNAASGHGTAAKLEHKDRVALDRANGDPDKLARIIDARGIDRDLLPPRHAATLNGHGIPR